MAGAFKNLAVDAAYRQQILDAGGLVMLDLAAGYHKSNERLVAIIDEAKANLRGEMRDPNKAEESSSSGGDTTSRQKSKKKGKKLALASAPASDEPGVPSQRAQASQRGPAPSVRAAGKLTQSFGGLSRRRAPSKK